jgi:hypothetical protein
MVEKKLIAKYGELHQKIKTIEELSELIQALVKDISNQENNVIEEMADVELMLDQLKVIYNVSQYDINLIKREKAEKALNKGSE